MIGTPSAGLRLVALFQILSGVSAFAYFAFRLLSGPVATSGHALAGLAVSPVVAGAGVLLFRGRRNGLRLSIGLQMAQVFQVAVSPIIYQFVIGPALVLSVEGSTLFLSPTLKPMLWMGIAAFPGLGFIRLNLLALVLFLYLRRRRSWDHVTPDRPRRLAPTREQDRPST